MAAMKVTKERPPAKLRMQELRDLNQVELTDDDRDKRYKEANAPQKACSHCACACHRSRQSRSSALVSSACWNL